jgi:uncharacterized membrane protein YqaE (UPF0057 family)
MRYITAFLCPPLAVLLCGRPLTAFLCLFCTLCFYFPGVIVACLVVADANAQRRHNHAIATAVWSNRRIVNAIQRQAHQQRSGVDGSPSTPELVGPDKGHVIAVEGGYDLPVRPRSGPRNHVAALVATTMLGIAAVAAYFAVTRPLSDRTGPTPETVDRKDVAAEAEPAKPPRRVAPDDRAVSLLRMGDSLAKMGKIDAAERYYRRIISEHPDAPAADEARLRLGEPN